MRRLPIFLMLFTFVFTSISVSAQEIPDYSDAVRILDLPESLQGYCEPCGPQGMFCCTSDDRGDDGDWLVEENPEQFSMNDVDMVFYGIRISDVPEQFQNMCTPCGPGGVMCCSSDDDGREDTLNEEDVLPLNDVDN